MFLRPMLKMLRGRMRSKALIRSDGMCAFFPVAPAPAGGAAEAAAPAAGGAAPAPAAAAKAKEPEPEEEEDSGFSLFD